jgi:hypothetical protein
MSGSPEIYCPHCTWRPGPLDKWACVPACGTDFNTFWTGGVCPGCGHHWQMTQCLSCQKYSPHKAWYHYKQGSEGEEKTRSPEREVEHA